MSGVELCLPWGVTDGGDDHVIASVHEPVEIARVHYGEGADDLAAYIVRAANEHIGLTRALHRVEGEARAHRTRADAADLAAEGLRRELAAAQGECARLREREGELAGDNASDWMNAARARSERDLAQAERDIARAERDAALAVIAGRDRMPTAEERDAHARATNDEGPWLVIRLMGPPGTHRTPIVTVVRDRDLMGEFTLEIGDEAALRVIPMGSDGRPCPWPRVTP